MVSSLRTGEIRVRAGRRNYNERISGILPTVEPIHPFLNVTRKAILWSSRAAFFITLVLIPVRYRLILMDRPVEFVSGDYTNFLLFAPEIALVLTLALWVLSLLIEPRRLTLGPRHIGIPLAGLTLAGLISLRGSFDRALSIYNLIWLGILLLFYLFIVNEIRSAVWVLIPIGLQAGTQSMIALAQFVAQRSVDLQKVGELYLDPSWAGISVVIANGVRLLRAYGLTDHPNILGGCLAFGMVLLLSAYLHKPARSAALIGLLPSIPALLVTFSRSAWLAFFAGAAVVTLAAILNHRREALKSVSWLALAGLVLLAPFVLAYARFFGARLGAGNSLNTPSPEQQSIGERILLIQYTWPIFKEHVGSGVGLGASPLALKAYYPNIPFPYEPPHLTPADAALETGIPGLVSYLALLVFPFIMAIHTWRSLPSNPQLLAALALLISTTLVGFFDYYTWLLVPGRLWQWLAWGWWAAAWMQATSSSSELKPVPASD